MQVHHDRRVSVLGPIFLFGTSLLLPACATTSAPPSAASATDGGGDATTAGGMGVGPSPDGAGSPLSDASGSSQDAANGNGGGTDGGDGGPSAVVYTLNPPNACNNQFYVKGCTSGNASTTCAGVCTPRNACEGDQTKTGPITFACGRYILFSPEFEQAAKDDALAAGWPNPDAPPFHYAVAGHDLDTGGLDSNVANNACCQCYQLVYSAPNSEYASAPAPPPLIVQAFNTAAGGPTNFDVYMGAGGYGGNDACFNANDSGTLVYGKYLFDSFPTDNEPGNGGVKFLDYTQCQDSTANGKATASSIESPACQNLIASRCQLISSNASPSLTSATRASCIAGNEYASLYHMNWQVLAKRVECPAHLTQVTGCKLEPQGLPQPNPTVTTAAAAMADSSFRSGYTTTTMQDCCKPTCAWADNVGDAGAAPWNSFYSCDQSGTPLTQ